MEPNETSPAAPPRQAAAAAAGPSAGPAAGPRSRGRDVILFDGVCSLCNTGADWVRARDRAGNFDLLPYQAPEVAARFPALDPVRLAEEMHVITPAGQVLRGVDAAARVLSGLPGWRWLGRLLGWRALAPVSRPAYRWVARRRRFLPGAPGRCPRPPRDGSS